MNNSQDIQRNYYNKTFKQESLWYDINFSSSTKFFIERFINSVISPDVKKVLEIGCGNGLLTFFLLKKELEVTAVDISEKAIERMRNQFAAEICQGKLELACTNIIEFLENTDEKYDVIIGSGIIHHIEKKSWDRLFRLAYERLNPGGIFACGPEPNASGIYSLAWRIARITYKFFGMDYDWEVEKGTLDMIPKNLIGALKNAGFEKAEVIPFQVIPHFRLNWLAFFDRKIIEHINGNKSLYIIIKGMK